MFTSATFQLIQKHCSTEFKNLLARLEIEVNWSGDEFRIYDKLDADLTEKICGLMKSSTIIDGYMNLLDLGGIVYSYNEPDELLGKVVANKDKILDAVSKANEDYDLWQEKWGNVSPIPEEVDVFKIEADTARRFHNPKSTSKLKEAWDKIKVWAEIKKLLSSTKSPDYHIAYQGIEGYVNDKRTPGILLELEGQKIPVRVEDVGDWIKQNMRYNETKIFCLKVTKSVEYQAKEIPTEPSKSDFTVDEAKETLNILAQLNEILSLAR